MCFDCFKPPALEIVTSGCRKLSFRLEYWALLPRRKSERELFNRGELDVCVVAHEVRISLAKVWRACSPFAAKMSNQPVHNMRLQISDAIAPG